MREAVLGRPRRKNLEGLPEAVVSKLSLKNEPGKREKWGNSRQRILRVERTLSGGEPGYVS